MCEISSLVNALHIDLSNGLQIIEAAAVEERHHAGVNVSWPLCIVGVASAQSMIAVQKVLLTAYPADQPLQIVVCEGEHVKRVVQSRLSALSDYEEVAGGVSLLVEPLNDGHDFTDLQQTIAHLRSPIGCPWDREQTMDSLRQDLLGEAIEVIEAIDMDGVGVDNGDHIAEELGDVLLMITMLVQIAIDEGRFLMADVLHHVVSKLIRRHPHVFGDVNVDNSDEVTLNWDAIKQQEKAAKGQSATSPLDGIPAQLPALEKARAMQSKAAKAELLDREQLAASMPALTEALGDHPDEESIGELLWVLTALAKQHDVVAENALRNYAVRYRERVQRIR